jgi:antitoxin component YwqK of YwqJK toxin-antitoxin module
MKRKFLNKTKPNPEDIWYISVNNEMVPKEGYQEVYDKEGVFVGKGNYKNGVRNGFWQFFYPNGKISDCGYYAEDGLRLSIKEYADTWDYYKEDGTKITSDGELPKEFQDALDSVNEKMAEDIFKD